MLKRDFLCSSNINNNYLNTFYEGNNNYPKLFGDVWSSRSAIRFIIFRKVKWAPLMQSVVFYVSRAMPDWPDHGEGSYCRKFGELQSYLAASSIFPFLAMLPRAHHLPLNAYFSVDFKFWIFKLVVICLSSLLFENKKA